MTQSMQTYLDQLQYIMDNGIKRSDRTGVGTISVFGLQSRYVMANGFPAITSKKLAWKSMVSELLWFISGSGNIFDLKRIYKHNKLWDANYKDYQNRLKKMGVSASNHGDMGRIYGPQWRSWRSHDGAEIDQLENAIALIKHNPTSRRIIVNAWNPAETDLNQVALPPCHSLFQFFVAGGKLSLQTYQRSADMFLGVPLNIASYALLLHIVAKITNLEAHEFIYTLGDAHIYLDARDQCQEQLRRKPYSLARLNIIDRGQTSIDDFQMDDFSLLGYRCHSTIKAKMAV